MFCGKDNIWGINGKIFYKVYSNRQHNYSVIYIFDISLNEWMNGRTVSTGQASRHPIANTVLEIKKIKYFSTKWEDAVKLDEISYILTAMNRKKTRKKRNGRPVFSLLMDGQKTYIVQAQAMYEPHHQNPQKSALYITILFRALYI